MINKLPPITKVTIIHCLDQLKEIDNEYNKSFMLLLIM